MKYLILFLFFLSWSMHASTYDFDKLKHHTNKPIDKNKIHIIYYSASFCKSCHDFSKYLIQFQQYNKNKYEIILVSFDINIEKFKKYCLKTPFIVVNYNYRKESGLYEYAGMVIPWMVIIDSNGEVIYSNMASVKILKILSRRKKDEN